MRTVLFDSKFLGHQKAYIMITRKTVGGWGACPNWEILMGLACVIPSLVLWTSMSGPVVPARALWGWRLTLLRNESKSGSVRSWMIPGGS